MQPDFLTPYLRAILATIGIHGRAISHPAGGDPWTGRGDTRLRKRVCHDGCWFGPCDSVAAAASKGGGRALMGRMDRIITLKERRAAAVQRKRQALAALRPTLLAYARA